MVKSKAGEPQKGFRYEEKVAEIESIISRIERGELDLQDVFQEFATAIQSLRECETFLQQRQEQVDLLIESLGDEM